MAAPTFGQGGGLQMFYNALAYKQAEKLRKEQEDELKRQQEEARRQQEQANKHSAFGANLQAIGTIGGAIAGSLIPIPGVGTAAGAAIGASLGNALASGTMAIAPNIGGTQPDASNPYYQPASDLQRGATALQSGLQVWSTYENQIREPYLRKAQNEYRANVMRAYNETNGGDPAATTAYMMPSTGDVKNFSQAMQDAGYTKDSLPWYISEDDIYNIENEFYIDFSEKIAPVGETGKLFSTTQALMAYDQLGSVAAEHVRKFAEFKGDQAKINEYIKQNKIDNPALLTLAKQPLSAQMKAWNSLKTLQNASEKEAREQLAKLKKENAESYQKQVNATHETVMKTWNNMVVRPNDFQMSQTLRNLVEGANGDINNIELTPEIFAQVYGANNGFGYPELMYDVMRKQFPIDTQSFFENSENPRIQKAYQLYLDNKRNGVDVTSYYGIGAQEDGPQANTTAPKAPASEAGSTTSTSSEQTTSDEADPATSSKPPISESARKSLSLEQQKELEQYLETPYQSFSKTDAFGNRIGGETPEEAARKAQERMQGYTFQDKRDYIKENGSLKGFYDQFARTQVPEEKAPEEKAPSAPVEGGVGFPIAASDLKVPRPAGVGFPLDASVGPNSQLATPVLNELDPNMREALRQEASQRRARELEAAKKARQTNAVPGGGTQNPATDANAKPVPLKRVGTLETGRPIYQDQLGRSYSEMPEVLEVMGYGFVVTPTVDAQTGQVRDIEQVSNLVMDSIETQGAPFDPDTNQQLPTFATKEEAETYRDVRKEDIKESVPSVTRFFSTVDRQESQGRTLGEMVYDQPQPDLYNFPDQEKSRGIPPYIGLQPPPSQAELQGIVDRMPSPATPDPLEANPTRTTGRQVRTTQGLIDEANREATMSPRQEDQSRKAADRWAAYQAQKAKLMGREEATIQPIPDTPAPKVKARIEDQGTITGGEGDQYYQKGGRYQAGEYEKVMEAQARDNATERRMDAEDDRLYDPRQSRASEFRKASPTIPTEEKSLRDAIIEGFPAADRDNLTSIMDQIIALESDGDPNAESPAGATGILQLMPGTIEQMMGKDADASDDDTYVAAANKLFSKNASLLERNSYSVNALNMYVLHHFGAGGKKLLDAAPETLVKDVTYYNVVDKKDTQLIQQKEVNANPWIDTAAEVNQKTWEELTVEELLEYLEQAVNAGDFPQPKRKVA